MTEPDAKLNLDKVPQMSDGKWKGMIETSSVTVYERENLDDKEPLFTESTITETIDQRIAVLEERVEKAEVDIDLDVTINELYRLKEKFDKSDSQ